MIPHSRPSIGPRERSAVLGVLSSRQIAQGPVVRSLEDSVALRAGVSAGIAVSSGTAALRLALTALGAGPGREVVVPDYACDALLHAVLATGARPAIADIAAEGPLMCPRSTGEKVNRRTAAIIVPHLFGRVQSLAPFLRLGVPVIEDCAQAFGIRVAGRPVGGQADAAILSFYATKLLCAGEGGMVITRSRKVEASVRDAREYDGVTPFRPRFNFKLTDLSAALALAQLSRLDRFLKRRAELARYYEENIRSATLRVLPRTGPDAHYRFVLVSRAPAARVVRGLERKGVAARRPVAGLLSRSLGRRGCPNSLALFERAVSIPLYPDLSWDEARRVVRAVNSL